MGQRNTRRKGVAMTGEFVETTGTVARQGEVSPPTVRLYAQLGLLEFTRDSRGNRLFRKGTGEKVREIYQERMARRLTG
jgi:DNA-binding transcriptional MerR regulator